MVGVSLTIAFLFVLVQKSLLLKCFTVLRLGFSSVTRNSHAEILCVFQGDILSLQEKRLGQNRIMFYETPPNDALSFGFFGRSTNLLYNKSLGVVNGFLLILTNFCILHDFVLFTLYNFPY